MATVNLDNKGSGSTGALANLKGCVTYSLENGKLTITKFQGWRNDGYRTWDVENTYKKVYFDILSSNSKTATALQTFTCATKKIDFPANGVKYTYDVPDPSVTYENSAGKVVYIRVRFSDSNDVANIDGAVLLPASSITISPLVTYKISYNANGGSGAPSSQTKTHGTNLTLSSTKPTRTGYSFLGWSTSSTATSATYSSGGTYTSNSATTLYAVWKADTYTISYNTNGGSGGPSSQTKTYGITLTLSTTKPTRTGYTFLGWSTSSTATSATYSSGGSYTSNAAATLYAVWKIITYTVTYSANGGSGAPSSQTKTYGVALSLSSTVPTRTGYDFKGWGTSSSTSTVSYSAGSAYTSNNTIDLYAVWSLKTYTVTYNMNGGTGGPSSQTKSYGTTLTLSSTAPARTGYTFLGWSTSSTATSATYSSGGNYTSNAAVTLYAVWKIITYSVSFSSNGGSGAPSSQTKTYGTNLTLSSTVPTRTGYDFKGWGTSSSTSTVSYAAGSTYSSNSASSLYAVWSLKTYTVSYNANGGSGAPSSQTKTYGTTLVLSSTIPTRTGYTFLGWSSSSTATSATYSSGGNYTSNAAVTLYAVWKQITYTVAYSANGGSGAPSSQTKIYGTNLTLSSTTPTRTGYTFKGWGTSSSTTTVSYSSGSTYSSNSAITLYAIWTINTYTMTFNANGGTGGPSTVIKTYGIAATIPSTPQPTRTGYTFLGWAITADATTPIIRSGYSGTFTGNFDRVYYAVWTVTTYAVTYSANNGTGAPSSQTKTYGVTLTLSSTVPTRTGYTFLGWSTSSTATSATYTAGGSYTANAAAALYAVWKLNTYTITFNANNGTGAPSSQTKTYGTNLTLSSTVPTRTGYTFLGWSTSSTATSATWSAGGTYSTNSANTLYAVWKINTYTVTYNGNSGSGTPSAQTKTYGINLTLSSTIPTRTGYNFKGWATTSNATTATYSAGGSYTNNSAVTLYAVWELITYTITYNANNGTGGPTTQIKTYGQTMTITSSAPTRTGYNFLGWSTSSNATTPTYYSGGSYVANSAATLYAVWKEITYTITYNANGGINAPSSQTKYYFSNLTLTTSIPKRPGYLFLGWATSADATEVLYESGATYSTNAAVTLYAVWRLLAVWYIKTKNYTHKVYMYEDGDCPRPRLCTIDGNTNKKWYVPLASSTISGKGITARSSQNQYKILFDESL